MNKLIQLLIIVIGLMGFSLSVDAQTHFKQSSHGVSYVNFAGGFHFYGSTTGAFEVIMNEDFISFGFSDGTMIAVEPHEMYMVSYDTSADKLRVAEVSQNEAVYLSPEARLILEEFEDHKNQLGSLTSDCPPGQLCGPIEINNANESASERFMRTQLKNSPSSAFCESVKSDLGTPFAGHSSLLGCTAGARVAVVVSTVGAILSCGASIFTGGTAGLACAGTITSAAASYVGLADANSACKASYEETKRDAELCAEEFEEARNGSGYKDMYSQVTGVNINGLRHLTVLDCIREGNVTITDLDEQATSSDTSTECMK
ncbi:MAG: hypothetical protein CMF19_09270 [Idiomarinaceae bacterium]|nr:hypothetical protein [Idiomarinaceae bacterium]MBL4741929.1 hypothetical protein [Idiomarina sp.]